MPFTIQSQHGSTTIDTCFTLEQTKKILRTLYEYDIVKQQYEACQDELIVTDSLILIYKEDSKLCDKQKENLNTIIEHKDARIRKLVWSRALFISSTVVVTIIAILK